MINLLQPGETISAQFRVISTSSCITESGADYEKLVLEDATGSIIGIVWRPEVFAEELVSILDFDIVQVKGIVKVLESGRVLEIKGLSVVVEKPVENATRLIPRSMAPIPSLLDDLVASVDALKNFALREFCHDFFVDLKVAEPFLTVQASRQHHHAYIGGLAEHSLDVAEIAGSMSGLNPTEQELARVGSLFHDIGKIHTIASPRPQALYLDHDMLTLEILSAPLAILSARNKRLADELRYIWTYRRALPRQHPVTPSAYAVWEADRISAGRQSVTTT